MPPAVIIILLFYKMYSAQAVRNSESLVISAEPGEAVTLNCTLEGKSGEDVKMWYKQRLEHAPLEVGSQLEGKSAMISKQFDASKRFKINSIANGFSLSIERVTKEDEGMYFCGSAGVNTLDFSTATFLAVKEKVQQGAVGERTKRQEQNTENLHYAAMHIKEKKAKGGRVKTEQPEAVVYTHVRSSKAAAQRSHH
ncbi:hypothetical protein MHYP_G00108070 [Metynnis hypsauchen]